MRREAKVANHGQVTIPEEIREALQIEDGDTVIFESDGTGVHLRASEPVSVFAKWEGVFREGRGKTREEILAEIREMRGDLP